MSKLPQLNLRIPADYHQLVRDIAARLRERDAPSFAHELDALVMGLAAAPPMPTAPREMLKRLEALETAQAAGLDEMREAVAKLAEALEMAQAVALPPKPGPAKGISDELLAQADDLNNQGWKWVDIAEHLGLKVQANSLRMAVTRRRNRAA